MASRTAALRARRLGKPIAASSPRASKSREGEVRLMRSARLAAAPKLFQLHRRSVPDDPVDENGRHVRLLLDVASKRRVWFSGVGAIAADSIPL